MDKTAFGAFLAQLRNENNLTQEQVAEHVNVNYKTVSKWECGNCLPDLDTLVKLANFYNVSLYELTVEYRKIKNPFITKNNINCIINKESKKRIIIINVIITILSLIATLFAIYCCIYTINNYNQVQIYELVSADDEFYVEGLFVKNHDKYYLSINNINCINNNVDFFEDKTSIIKYALTADNTLNETNTIKFDQKYTIKHIFSSINFYIYNKKLPKNIEYINLKIEYINENSKLIKKTYQIKLLIKTI